MSPCAFYCKYSASLAAFFQTRPCCPWLQRWTWVHIFRPTLDLAVQNNPKLSQIIKNTSIATVVGSLIFCDYPVTLFELLIVQMCQIEHCRTYTLNSIQLRFHSVCMWYPATILHETVNFYWKISWRYRATLCRMLWNCAKQPLLVVPPIPESSDEYYQI